MSNNKIMTLIFNKHHTYLKTLDVSNNSLTEFKGFDRLSESLENLNLSNN